MPTTQLARHSVSAMMSTRLVSAVAMAVVAGLVAAAWPRVAYRLAVPATEPPGSGCARCGRRFQPGWRGWLRFGRICRTCPPGPLCPWWAVSALVALASGTLTWQAHPLQLHRSALLLAWLVVAEIGTPLTMIDVSVHRLPTPLITAMGAGVAACLAVSALVARDPRPAVTAALAGVVLGGGYLLLALFTPSQVGMGDVRLAAVLGAALGAGGWNAVLLGAALPYLLAVPFTVVLLRPRSIGDGQVPFGPFLVSGAVLAAVVAGF